MRRTSIRVQRSLKSVQRQRCGPALLPIKWSNGIGTEMRGLSHAWSIHNASPTCPSVWRQWGWMRSCRACHCKMHWNLNCRFEKHNLRSTLSTEYYNKNCAVFQCVFNLGSLQQIKKCTVFQCVFNLGPLQKAWEEVWWQGHCHEAGAFGMLEECEAPEVQGSEKTSKVRGRLERC